MRIFSVCPVCTGDLEDKDDKRYCSSCKKFCEEPIIRPHVSGTGAVKKFMQEREEKKRKAKELRKQKFRKLFGKN